MKEVKVLALFHTNDVQLPINIPLQNDDETFPTVGPLIGGELSDYLKGMLYHPTQFRIEFNESGEIAQLHRVDLLSLEAGGVGHIFYLGESLGSVELLNDELVINDDEDPALLYVKNILSDLI